MDLVRNVHLDLPYPDHEEGQHAKVTLVVGDYEYYHYACDGQDDRGWGCGYRTLQSLCSWVYYQKLAVGINPKPVPTLPQIQDALVKMDDKPSTFIDSKQWIGSVEIALVLDDMYDVPCKIVHIRKGIEIKNHVAELQSHFTKFGSPIMMGGNSDAASKGIFGICEYSNTVYLLIVDPHYYGRNPTKETLIENHMLAWRSIDTLTQDSFYNLCLPQLSGK